MRKEHKNLCAHSGIASEIESKAKSSILDSLNMNKYEDYYYKCKVQWSRNVTASLADI